MPQPQPDVIPVPLDFPVNWKHPDEKQLLWTQDRLHCPDAMTPLDFSFIQIIDGGIDKAAQVYDIPIVTYDRHINSYLYIAVVPQESSPDEMAAQAQRSEEKLKDAMGNLGELWEKEWLPEIQQCMVYFEEYDLRGAHIPALLEHLNETERRLHRVWEIHFLLIIPTMLVISEFADMYQDLFSDASEFDAYELLVSFENRTVESGQLLWKLSRKALASPTLRQVFAENPASNVIAKLSESADGKAFLAELNGYLELYGHRADKITLNYPCWIENPTPVIKNLQDYIAQPERDLLAEMEKIAARREQRIEEVREQLQGYPQPIVQQFEFFLEAAQVGNILKEEHGHWIDFKVFYQTRQILLEIGRRLAEAGIIDVRDDVFYLYLNELKEVVARQAGDQELHSLIDERKAIEQRFAALTPPPMLGTFPSDPPPDDSISRMFLKIEGNTPPPSEVPNELRGNAGSPGVVQGTAKVVRVLAEAQKLEPGDILVAEATAPPWTPLFASVGAVVTDSGGILSHCAVVAREYGIPAVVGTGTATTVIQDGQTVEVNGNIGMVRIVST